MTVSQDLRDGQGWEHHRRDAGQVIAAMAAAVAADLDIYGPDCVAALAVTHVDAEGLADHIRADLVEKGCLDGPALDGPGWAGPRRYQAGDRVLLHAHAYLDRGRRLTNGTVATVTRAGLTITTNDEATAVLLPAAFVTALGSDGRPQVSHAWARTIDGVQGGTWDQVHLLATPALDRYRGYVGQSRSIQPTHTWNTAPDPDDDHGGLIVETYTNTAERVAAALARAEAKTFAADDDPYRAERLIHAEQATQHAELDRRPPDVTDQLPAARATITTREEDLARPSAALAHWDARREATAGIRAMTPSRRASHAAARDHATRAAATVEGAETALRQAHQHHEDLQRQQVTRGAFDDANRWRHQRIDQLQGQLDEHWTAAVISAARDGHPYAYGPQRLRAARRTLADRVEHPEASPMPSVDDPFRALLDLDRATTEAARTPAPRVGSLAQPPSAPGVDIHLMHHHAAQVAPELFPSAGPAIQV